MTTKSTTNWMPENPCVECDFEGKQNRNNWYEVDNKCCCHDEYSYRHAIAAQKELLEHLKRQRPSQGRGSVYQYVQLFESMLKQLEEL